MHRLTFAVSYAFMANHTRYIHIVLRFIRPNYSTELLSGSVMRTRYLLPVSAALAVEPMECQLFGVRDLMLFRIEVG